MIQDHCQLFNEVREAALVAVLQRLQQHADSLSVETAFTAGWEACLEFNRRAEIVELDAHTENHLVFCESPSCKGVAI